MGRSAEFASVEPARSTPTQCLDTLTPSLGEVPDSTDEFLRNLAFGKWVVWVQPANGNMSGANILQVGYVHEPEPLFAELAVMAYFGGGTPSNSKAPSSANSIAATWAASTTNNVWRTRSSPVVWRITVFWMSSRALCSGM